MFGGFGTKFSLIARKIVAQAAQQLSAWPVWFSGQAVIGSRSMAGDYTFNSVLGTRVPFLGGTGQSWVSVAPGNHNLGVKSDGTLWTWGTSSSGEMGTGSTTFVVNISPVQVGADTNWKEARRTIFRSIALKQNGTLWSWGILPGIDSSNAGSPVQIGNDTWSFINAGGQNRFAIKSDGTLWGWGSNMSSSCALPYIQCEFPVRIGTDTDWSSLSLGYRVSLALKTNGTLWSWGGNYQNAGGGPTAASSVPNQVGSTNTWNKISVSTNHGLGIRSDGTLWAWGRNNYGQLGLLDATNRSSPVQIGAATDWASLNQNTGSSRNPCSFAIKTGGTLWAWGRNNYGQLGIGNLTNVSSPVQVGSGTTGDWSAVFTNGRTTFATKTNGTLWSWGNANYGALGTTGNQRSSPVQVGTDVNWNKIFLNGLGTVFATKTTGTLLSWGRNNFGQLGLGNTTNRSSPVQIGSDTNWQGAALSYPASLAFKDNGQIWFSGRRTWVSGYTTYGFIFFGGDNQLTMTASAPLAGHTGWSSLYCGGAGFDPLVIGKKTNGEIWSWGNRFPNSSPMSGLTGWFGTQGNIASTPIQVGTDTNWNYVATSTYHHTMATKTNGTLWAWGNNYRNSTRGWLGFGGAVKQTSSPTQVGTDANWKCVIPTNSCTIGTKTDGTIWSWGSNGNGQLGLGNQTSRSSPVQIGTLTDWDRPFRNGELTTIAALKTDGTAWGWGRNQEFMLGLTFAFNNNFTQIGTDTNWTDEISSTVSQSGHIVTRKSDGTLWTWGRNSNGQLGQNTSVTDTSSPVQVGTDTNWSKIRFNDGDWSSAIKSNGTIWTWGGGANGKLGHGNVTTRSSPVQVGADTDWNLSIGTKSSILAIKNNNTLWAWGSNSSGELGLGDTTARSSPVQVGALADWQFVDTCSVNPNTDGIGYGGFTMAIKTNGGLWAWGNNGYGQLGLGDISNRTSPVRVGTGTDWKSVRAVCNLNRRGMTLAIKTNGTLWAWGDNYNYLFGDPLVSGNARRSSPVQVGTDTDWDDFSGFSRINGTLAVKKTNGTLWSWGPLSPKLKYTGYIRASKPVQLFDGITGWTNFIGGSRVGIARKQDGTIWHIGSSNAGMHGGAIPNDVIANTISLLSSPVQMGTDNDWKSGSVIFGAEGNAGVGWLVAMKGS